MHLWDSYKLGFSINYLGMYGETSAKHSISKKIKMGVYNSFRRIAPIDYVRWRELSFVYEAIDNLAIAPKRVLDISSPKLLPLTIARKCPQAMVHSGDIVEAEVSLVEKAKYCLKMKNITAHIEDARNLSFPDNYFDLITSISVFEHIAPEIGGEIPASRELKRVLAPGGIAILTVPFARESFAEYVKGSIYERTANSDEAIFFQRFYDTSLLKKNIIEPSALELVALKFIDERFFYKDPRKRLSHYINSSTYQNLIFGSFYPILARIFLSEPKALEDCQKPYIACLVMEKRCCASA